MKRTGQILLGLLIVSACVTAAAPNKELMTLFQDALYQEQTAGDLDKAIELYQKVVADSGEIEKLAAKATFQLGMCYLKKDDKDKAAEYFRKVVSTYPSQKELVTNAQKQLGQIAPQDVGGVPNKKTKAYKQNLKQLIKINISQSPDGDKLTIQYAVMAIAKAVDVPYQWDKSAELSESRQRRYIEPVFIDGKTAEQALADLLGPVDLSYGVAEEGVFLFSPEMLKKTVENAVLTISTCTETDPKVKQSLESLQGIDTNTVVKELCKYLDSETDTVRRSAIFILWQGEFPDISAAGEKLIALCNHKEQYTRGMAAIALGAGKIPVAYDVLVKMTTDDKDGYARRCGAYALGLFGDQKALPILEQALKDNEDMVKQNAQAAITMLTKLKEIEPMSVKPSKPDKLRSEDLTAEGWKLWQERKLAEAEKKFEEAVAADPTSDGAYQGLGWAQLNQGKKSNAKASFEKCVELNPKNAAALNGLGWIAHGQDDKDQAIVWWEKAVKAQPGATASLSGLTQVYMEREDYVTAVKYYKMWLKAEPNNQDAKDGLEKAVQLLPEKKQ